MAFLFSPCISIVSSEGSVTVTVPASALHCPTFLLSENPRMANKGMPNRATQRKPLAEPPIARATPPSATKRAASEYEIHAESFAALISEFNKSSDVSFTSRI